MNKITKCLLVAGLSGWSLAAGADDFGQLPPMLADGIRLPTKVVEVVYAMPEEITEVDLSQAGGRGQRQQHDGKRHPQSARHQRVLPAALAKGSHGDIDMHVVMDGQTYTFRILIGSTMVNYRKTYTLQGGPVGQEPPAGAPAGTHGSQHRQPHQDAQPVIRTIPTMRKLSARTWATVRRDHLPLGRRRGLAAGRVALLQAGRDHPAHRGAQPHQRGQVSFRRPKSTVHRKHEARPPSNAARHQGAAPRADRREVPVSPRILRRH